MDLSYAFIRLLYLGLYIYQMILYSQCKNYIVNDSHKLSFDNIASVIN